MCVCVCACVRVLVHVCLSPYHFDQLGDGDLKGHHDRVGDVLHWADELVVAFEQLLEQLVLRLGGEAVCRDREVRE